MGGLSCMRSLGPSVSEGTSRASTFATIVSPRQRSAPSLGERKSRIPDGKTGLLRKGSGHRREALVNPALHRLSTCKALIPLLAICRHSHKSLPPDATAAPSADTQCASPSASVETRGSPVGIGCRAAGLAVQKAGEGSPQKPDRSSGHIILTQSKSRVSIRWRAARSSRARANLWLPQCAVQIASQSRHFETNINIAISLG